MMSASDLFERASHNYHTGIGSSGINGTSIIIFINEWAGHRKSRGMGGRGQQHTYSSLQPRTIVRIRTYVRM